MPCLSSRPIACVCAGFFDYFAAFFAFARAELRHISFDAAPSLGLISAIISMPSEKALSMFHYAAARCKISFLLRFAEAFFEINVFHRRYDAFARYVLPLRYG